MKMKTKAPKVKNGWSFQFKRGRTYLTVHVTEKSLVKAVNKFTKAYPMARVTSLWANEPLPIILK